MRRSLLPILAALLLATSACSKSSTEPNRTVHYTGTLSSTVTSVEDSLTMKGTGNARATLVTLTQTAADGTTGPATVNLNMGIGPSATPCAPTGNFLFQPQSHISIGLDRGSYCLRFSPAGTLATGVSVDYDLQIEITD